MIPARTTFWGLGLAVAVAGCGSAPPPPSESSEAPVPKKLVPAATPSDSLPGDFPVFPNMVPVDSVPFESGDAKGRRFVFEVTTASGRQIEDFYAESLRKAGWKQDDREVEYLGKSMGLDWSKGNQRCGVLIVPGSGTETVMILLANLPVPE